ncbi:MULTISPECIES: TonB-dependent receptor domain-containing protein [unclassified Lonepinella]|uniref:TonB-dependent receptor domain-containing protein n=1 Tax=unclassified Lonepinella TaxID=2642006 RepID=UPI0036D7CC03
MDKGAYLIIGLLPILAHASSDVPKNELPKKISQLETILVKEQRNYDDNETKSYLKSGSYSYLQQSNITQFRGSSVGDFLTGISGVTASNKRNSGALTVNIRGLANEDRVPIFVDNALQSVPSWQGYAGSSTRTYLDPDLISTAEIEKGPSMESDGVGAIGGVVRMSTIGWKDIIPEGKTWGVRIQMGTMSNTVSPPDNYTVGGYQTRYIASCRENAAGLCQEQSYAPDARYSSHSPKFNSYNTSIAFANKWENADVVLAYAKRKQGNYYIGKHGQLPEIASHEIEEEESISMDVEDTLARWGKTSLDDITDQEQEDNAMSVYNYPNYQRINKDIDMGIITLKENHSTLYRAGEEALNTSQNTKSYLGKINLYNDQHKLSLGYSRYHSQFGEIMPSILNFRGVGALQGEGTEVKADTYTIGYQYNPNNPYINLNLQTYYSRVDSSNFTPYLEELGYSWSSRHAHFSVIRQKGISLKNTSQFNLNQQPLTLTYGISHAYGRISQPRDTLSRVRAKGYPDDAVAPFYIRNGKRRENSVFVNANYPFVKQLKLDLGLRYTRTEINDYQPNVIFGAGGATKTEYQEPIKVNGFSPIAMLTYEPMDGIQLFVKHARATKAPSLFQGTKGFSMQVTDNALQVLRPEKTRDWEVGTNIFFENIGNFDNVLGFKLNYFDNNIKDYITRTTTGGQTAQTFNIRSATFKGIESSAYFDMQRFYAKLSATRYTKIRYCLYAHQTDREQLCSTNIKDSNLNNQMPSKLTYHITLGTRLFDNKLDLGARYSYYGKRYVPTLKLTEDRTSSIEWNAYSLVDLFASYQVTENLKVNFNVDNLFNRYYLDVNNMGLNTAPGRTVRVNFDYKF